MRLPRTFLALLAAAIFAGGLSACGGEGSNEPDATTTTDVGPQEVDDPGEGGTPGDGSAPAPADSGTDY